MCPENVSGLRTLLEVLNNLCVLFFNWGGQTLFTVLALSVADQPDRGVSVNVIIANTPPRATPVARMEGSL